MKEVVKELERCFVGSYLSPPPPPPPSFLFSHSFFKKKKKSLSDESSEQTAEQRFLFISSLKFKFQKRLIFTSVSEQQGNIQQFAAEGSEVRGQRCERGDRSTERRGGGDRKCDGCKAAEQEAARRGRISA